MDDLDELRKDINEVREDVKEIKRDVGDIKVTLSVNTANLQQHMYRTALSEKRIAKLEYWLLGLLATIIVALARILFNQGVS